MRTHHAIPIAVAALLLCLPVWAGEATGTPETPPAAAAVPPTDEAPSVPWSKEAFETPEMPPSGAASTSTPAVTQTPPVTTAPAGTPLLPLAPTPPAAKPGWGGYAWGIEYKAGLQAVWGNTHSSKFDEYREVPAGPVLDWLRADGERPSGQYLQLTLANAGRRDQEALLVGGQWGQYSLHLSWNRIPHSLSNNSELIFDRRGSVYTLPPAVHDALATVAGAKPLDKTAFQDAVDGAEKPFPLGFSRDTWAVGGTVDKGSGLSYSLDYSDEHRTGTEPIGATFSFTNEVELPEPIDYHTRDLNLGLQYLAGWGPVQLSYWGQQFSDEFSSLTWDNPIALVDSATASSRGRLALPPSNTSHTWSLATAANLGRRSRLSGTFSFARWTQDEALLPPTINSALTVDPLPETHAGLALDTIMGNLLFTSRLSRDLSLSASWRRYRLRDNRPSLLFQQVITDVEVDDSEDTGEQITDYRRDDLNLDLNYAATRALTLDLGLGQERWHRKHRDVNSNTDHITRLGANYLVNETLGVRAYYRWRDRTGNYVAANEDQLPDLRKYDEANRKRREAGLMVQLTPSERWEADLSYDVTLNDYDQSLFGLANDNASDISLEGAYARSPRTTLYLGLSRERNHSHLRDRYRPVDANGDPIDDPLNDWDSFMRDRDWTWWLGATRVFVPDKWEGEGSLTYTDGIGSVRATGVPGGAAQSEPVNWPDVKFTLLSLDLSAYRRVRADLKWQFRYRFERYHERDFVQDIMQPYMGFIDSGSGTSIYMNAHQPSYSAHIFSVSVIKAF